MAVTSYQFGVACRALAAVARDECWVVPSFRSPPNDPDVNRTIRHRPGAPPVVSVRLAGRDGRAVVGDLVEGVIAANQLDSEDVGLARWLLWAAVSHLVPA